MCYDREKGTLEGSMAHAQNRVRAAQDRDRIG